MSKKSSYDARGVSSTKEEVHVATKNLDKGIFPRAFCKILPDILGGDEDMCVTSHADTAGTKQILHYLYWQKTGDASIFKDLVKDALVMNLDDLGCSGITNNIVVCNTILRNKHLVSGEVVKQLIEGTEEYLSWLRRLGMNIHSSGGETADVGDVVRTLDVGYSFTSRVPRSDILEIDIKPGDRVIGFSSAGVCAYNGRPNSGIGANGLTDARHDLLHMSCAEMYPEVYDRESVERGLFPQKLLYNGSYEITDDTAQLLLSPTRTYLPLILSLKNSGVFNRLSGVIHNTGGGHAKVKNFIQGCEVIKHIDTAPKIFTEIQAVRNNPWEDMFRTFNMGCRMEFYGDRDDLREVLDAAQHLDLDMVMEGAVVESREAQESTVRIKYGGEEYCL